MCRREKSGRSGALPWIGEGRYKRSFTIPEGFNVDTYIYVMTRYPMKFMPEIFPDLRVPEFIVYYINTIIYTLCGTVISLFLSAILFGAFGGTLGMFVFRHKTKHWYFRVFFPLLMVLQFGLLGYLWARGIL